MALARMQLDAADPARELLEQAETGCQRAVSLASQLLTFARGGAPVRRTAPVSRLVTGAVHLARAGSNVTIDLEIAEDLWSAEVDVGQISQVLHNVLLNARQAMPDGGTIQVRAENFRAGKGAPSLEPGDYIRISIRDRGCGIFPDVLGRVFDPYFTTKEGGSGLGLATAYAIVSKHGGHIGVESTPGVETTVSIHLPASQCSEPAGVPSQPPLRTRTGRILVVDDEDALRMLMTQMLARLGYEAECAREGGEAVALYEGAKASGRAFDAVIVDLTIPGGMGGIEAAAKLREIDAGVKLIVSSGYSDAPVMSEFRRYGFDAVIPKPWTLNQVSGVFRQVFTPNTG
ncbi:MAG: ATP-binding protein [Bryobacteraceae bacterium]